MSPSKLAAKPLDLEGIRSMVDTTINDFLDDINSSLEHPHLIKLTKALRDFLAAGGKRLRPLLCVVGWHAAGGVGSRIAVLRLAASLELLHAAMLIHDDLIDASATRRGFPTAHHALAAQRPDAAPAHALRYGTNAALLLGDLTLVWSEHMAGTQQLTDQQRASVLPILEAVRREVLCGQFLDLLSTGDPGPDLDTALAIARYKTAHYTVERPLQAGAALAGAAPRTLQSCSAIGIPLGEAFQLRDDLLGVFGDPAHTGKPVLDDLREGKHTPLIALAFQRATPAQRAFLRQRLGRPGLTETDAAAIRKILTDTGARHTVEEMIAERHRLALIALESAPFHPDAESALYQLAETAVRRIT